MNNDIEEAKKLYEANMAKATKVTRIAVMIVLIFSLFAAASHNISSGEHWGSFALNGELEMAFGLAMLFLLIELLQYFILTFSYRKHASLLKKLEGDPAVFTQLTEEKRTSTDRINIAFLIIKCIACIPPCVLLFLKVL